MDDDSMLKFLYWTYCLSCFFCEHRGVAYHVCVDQVEIVAKLVLAATLTLIGKTVQTKQQQNEETTRLHPFTAYVRKRV